MRNQNKVHIFVETKRKNMEERTTLYWGIEITIIEEMKWQKFASDRNNCPALNTISQEERVNRLNDFIKNERNKSISNED